MCAEEKITVKIFDLAYGGRGIGTISSGPDELIGKKAFVPYTIPGEEVEARIIKNSKNFIEAELVSVLETSELRVVPACPYFYDCGGCQLQHIPNDSQRSLKRNLIFSMLNSAGIKIEEHNVELIGKDLPAVGYRNRVTLHLAANGNVGFFKVGTAEVVSIEKCLIASNVLNQGLKSLIHISTAISNLVASVVLEDHKDKLIAVFNMHNTANIAGLNDLVNIVKPIFQSFSVKHSRKIIYRSAVDLNLNKVPGHFSQVNDAGNELLKEHVLELLSGSVVDDLYAGSGNFSFPLVALNKSVRAVEFDPELVSSGRLMAEELEVQSQIKFIKSSCEKFAKFNKLSPSVLLDPPRAGAKEVVKRINSKNTFEIVYVSCGPPTFIRDARTLIDKGYKLQKILVIDMFPQTGHIELIGNFSA